MEEEKKIEEKKEKDEKNLLKEVERLISLKFSEIKKYLSRNYIRNESAPICLNYNNNPLFYEKDCKNFKNIKINFATVTEINEFIVKIITVIAKRYSSCNTIIFTNSDRQKNNIHFLTKNILSADRLNFDVFCGDDNVLISKLYIQRRILNGQNIFVFAGNFPDKNEFLDKFLDDIATVHVFNLGLKN